MTQLDPSAETMGAEVFEGGIAFSDIIASTALAEEIGDAAWLRVMREQEETTHRLAREHDVDVVGCVGDGFLLRSAEPRRLVAMGISLQRLAMAQGVPLRVGMHYGHFYCSLHTLVGFDVHVAARLTDLARINEIVLSNVIAERAGLSRRTRVRKLRGVSRPCRFCTITVAKERN